jgi:chorismate mutase
VMHGVERAPSSYIKSMVKIFTLGLIVLCGCWTGWAQGTADAPVVRVQGAEKKDLSDLTELIDARLQLMAEVAKSKWNSHGAIEDPVREQKVLDDVRQKAEQAGLPPLWVEHFFREQIEAAKLIQYQLLWKWKQENHGPFADAPDLVTQVRPKLDDLSAKMMVSLQAHWVALKAAPVSRADVGKMKEEQESPRAVNLAVLPLMDGSAQVQP